MADTHDFIDDEEQDYHPPRVDEERWRNSVVDLKRVMGACRALYIVLEQESEAMLRVACELVTDKGTKHVLWWGDYWWSDEDQRESFRAMVQAKLKGVISTLNGGAGNGASRESREQQLREEKLRAELAKMKAALQAQTDASEKARRTMELDLKAAEEKANAAGEQIASLEAACEKLRNELRQLKQGMAGDDTAKQLEEALAKLANAEKRLEQMSGEGSSQASEFRRRLSEAEAASRELQAKMAEKDAELERMREEARRLQAALDKSQEDLKNAHKEEVKTVAKPTKAGADPAELKSAKAENQKLQEQINALKKQMQELEGSRQRIQELEASEQKLKTAADVLRAEIEQLKERLKEADSKRAGPVEVKPVEVKASETVVKEVVVKDESAEAANAELSAAMKAMKRELREKEEEVTQLREEVEKLKGRVSKQAKTIEELRADKEALEAEKMKIMAMLHKCREQIKSLMALAERKGLKSVVEELMQESGLAEVTNSDEWSIFDRLYEDAVRRQEKQRRIQESRIHVENIDMSGRGAFLGGGARQEVRALTKEEREMQMYRPTGMTATHERFLGPSRPVYQNASEPMRSGFMQAAPGRQMSQTMSQSLSAPNLEEQARSTFTVLERSRSPERMRLPGVQEETQDESYAYARQREPQQVEPSFLAVQQLSVPGGYRDEFSRQPMPRLDRNIGMEPSPSPPMGSTWYGNGGKNHGPVVVQSSSSFSPVQGFESFGQSNASTWTGAYDSMGSFSSTMGAGQPPRWPLIAQGSEASPRLPRLATRGASHTASAPQLPKVPQSRSMPQKWHQPRHPFGSDGRKEERPEHGAQAVRLVGKGLGY